MKNAAAQPVTKMVIANPNDLTKELTLDVNKLSIPIVHSHTCSMRYTALVDSSEIDIT